MSKNRSKISIAIDGKLKSLIDELNYNKSKLINSLLEKWLKNKNNLDYFKKKSS